MRTVRKPFVVVNPKSYLYGEQALELAKTADQLAAAYDIDIIFTCQHVDVRLIKEETTQLIVSVQHIDGIVPGRGMGHVLPEGVAAAGAEATFLNHAERPLSVSELCDAVKRAKELGLLTIVCANSLEEAKLVASLKPDVMVCEPTELIGTGQASDISYMIQTNEAVRKMDPEIFVLQAAGISTVADVRKALDSGADATGGTSGIVCAKDPVDTLKAMIEEVSKWKKEQSTK